MAQARTSRCSATRDATTPRSIVRTETRTDLIAGRAYLVDTYKFNGFNVYDVFGMHTTEFSGALSNAVVQLLPGTPRRD